MAIRQCRPSSLSSYLDRENCQSFDMSIIDMSIIDNCQLSTTVKAENSTCKHCSFCSNQYSESPGLQFNTPQRCILFPLGQTLTTNQKSQGKPLLAARKSESLEKTNINWRGHCSTSRRMGLPGPTAGFSSSAHFLEMNSQGWQFIS